jgi:hypothetical protein
MIRRLLFLFAAFLTPVAGFCQETPYRAQYIDDEKFMRVFEKAILKLAEDGKGIKGREFRSQMNRKTCDIPPAPPSAPILAPEEIYTGCSGGVMAICSAFKSATTGGWEAGDPATAWVLTPDGVMVSNYHIFAGAEKEEVFAVMSRDGVFYPVTEILAADKVNDIVIFKIHAKGLQPLALAGDEPVGKKVFVISHPDHQFYTFTQGHITRYTVQYDDPKQPPIKYLCTTAEFARGSSGGPVLNEHGAVIGMVCSTRNTYYGEKNKDADDDVQMIVKFCIPCESIRALLKPTPLLSSKPPDKSEPPKIKPAPEPSEVKPPSPPPPPPPEPVPPRAEPVPEPVSGQP